MRILYGIQGTGNGHLTRARVMAPALKSEQIEVDYLFSGRAKSQFFDMQAFGDFRCLSGLTFATRNGKVDIVSTALNNKLVQFWRDVHALDLSQYDLVLNDFEPVSAWAAKRQGKPCISVSHQNAFQHDVPVTGQSWIDKQVMNHFAPASILLGCHWHHFGCDLLPPFIEAPHQSGDEVGHVLVYLPFESPQFIRDMLDALPQVQFRVYHAQQAPADLPAHIHWHGFDRLGFQQHLAGCCGVISSAGFELVSEALVLGKKLLLKPLGGQFEQASNALALELLGAAQVMQQGSSDEIQTWLNSRSCEPIHYPQMGPMLAKWLKQGEWNKVSELCQQAWSEAKLPESWKHKWAYAY
ncbi:MJ1255/VC2487 family glycosyltransferase [Ferrimonas aestuarii]|uniref:Glycosyltransferase n=1 Tax=Ferrimonas aestuarii TaxID=2569539 RepID=A0A4U1BTV4_9GAMM|nr:MJ1255/VC2487 family glycosyltransferase [Ferrimonas aestuarii]TKB56083.1 glycosyltransferase [Ferrimonas aestuarii]